MKNQDLENLKWYQRSMLDNMWMLMALIYSTPHDMTPHIDDTSSMDTDEYLFGGHHTNHLDIYDHHDVYLDTDDNHHDTDFDYDHHDFGYNHLDIDCDSH